MTLKSKSHGNFRFNLEQTISNEKCDLLPNLFKTLKRLAPHNLQIQIDQNKIKCCAEIT